MRALHVSVVLLVVLAGCGSGLAPPTAAPSSDTDTASPEPTLTSEVSERNASIAVEGGELPIDPEPVFLRVLKMTDTDVDEPTIYIESSDEKAPGILDREQSAFRRSLGIRPPESNGSVRLGAYTPADGQSVHLYEWMLSDPVVSERVLAHEFVHVVQFETGWGGAMWNNQTLLNYERTYDGYMTYYLVLEGSGTYVQDRYERAYQPTVNRTAMERKRAQYRNASPLVRLSLARYHYGSQYVDEEADSPADLKDIHLNAPKTTEQVLHNTRDPIAPLNVSVNESDGWNVEDRTRMGELFLRIALRTELNRSAAVAGADGWGDDRKISYTNGESAGYAWVLTWDDEANATEFADTFGTYLDAKATKEGDLWVADEGNSSYRVERVSVRTVVVVLGNHSFVENATTETEDGVVTVGP
jgi:hypothetical protein